MVYIYENGRILYSPNIPSQDDTEKYIALETLPDIGKIDGKIGIITGCDPVSKEVFIEYVEIPSPPKVPDPEPTETERIMQGFTDSELRDLEIQQNQELLAQQITDIEVALLGGGR